MNLLEEIIVQAQKRGFKDKDINSLRIVYNNAFYEHLKNSSCGTGLTDAISNVDRAQEYAYTAGFRYVKRTIDSWHSQADGDR